MSETVPVEVLEAYGLEAANRIPGGLINATFVGRRRNDGGEPIVVQRLHPIFAAEVNLDIAAITAHLADRGLETPRLVETLSGDIWVERDGEVWRALTYIEGETVDAVSQPGLAAAAGELVGRFHAALADCDHRFVFTRSGVHDTDAHLAKLEGLATGDYEGEWVAQTRDLAQAILDRASTRPRWGELPLRIVHGDLKISNVRFASLEPPIARCLIDLDTLGRMVLPYELGDALRSWCNRAEDQEPRFSVSLFSAALEGYWRGCAGAVTPAELRAVPAGAEVVAIELAARFCSDTFEDCYFGWDAERFESRRTHNLIRARGQLELAHQIRARAGDLEAAVSHILGE